MRRGKRYLKDLDADIRDHIERETQDNIDAGMPPDEARREALRKFGNVALIEEDTRAVWVAVWLEQLLQDSRYAVRSLLRNPGFTIVAVLTLALGIGMTTAVFSVFNAVLLRPLPYPDPERLLWVTTYEREWNEEFVSDVTFKEWRDQATAFEQLVAYETRDVSITAPGDTIRARVALVSEDFWKVSGAVPALGRLPQHGQSEILLSHRFFERGFRGDPAIVGSLVMFEGQQVTIAGVLPEDARLPLPRPFFSLLSGEDIAGYASAPDTELSNLAGVIAKLKPDAPFDAGMAELQVIRARTKMEGRPSWMAEMELRVVPLQEKLVAQARRPLWILMAAVAFVLLITCANVANLLLARASARQKEISIRVSIGAGRIRVFRQFLAETTVLAMLGGIGGLLLARWAITALVRLAPQAIPRLEEVTMAGNVLAFAIGAAIVTAFLFGLAPALSVLKPNLHDLLRDGRVATASPARLRVRRLLVATELVLAAVLLTGAGLMVKSFWLMYAHPPGFNPERILMLKTPLAGSGYFRNLPRQHAYLDEILRRVRAVPGVTAASILYRGSTRPFPENGWEGAPPLLAGQQPPTVVFTGASADYAKVMGMRLVRGRWLTDTEPDPVIVINETLARRDFPGQDPIGRRLNSVGTVVGVVADLKFSKLDANPEPEIFVSYLDAPRLENAIVMVLTTGDAVAAAPAIQKLVSDVDRTQAIYDVMTVERALADSIAPRRFNLFLLGSFATAALSLALIGIYGVTAYSVAQRTHEIGIRMALGAQRGEVVRMVLRQAMKTVLPSIVVGLAAALALTRVMTSLLYDVEPTDPQTFAAVSVALLATAFVACWLPALKAALVDPLVALRYE
jgi:putative ABC transport system permease protein